MTGPVESDQRFMAAAIRLSRRHLGLTAENPSVGSLIVAPDGAIVGRGVTALGGRPHAELQALEEAGPAARGATAYATLEPCSHIGKAPPCADALVAAGVARVVIATLDPDIRVAGRGVSILTKAGIEVVTGYMEAEAKRAMAGFLSLKGRGRPFLTLKLAVSADGMLGKKGAGQVAITGETSRRVTQMLRVEHEAIMAGVGTVAEDDPRLTVRLQGLEQRSPMRVIIDPFARTPAAAELLEERGASKVLILASEKAPKRAVETLRARGAMVNFLASDHRGRFEPKETLRSLGILGIKSVLLEGGADTAGRFLDAGLVDRIVLFIGKVMVGEGGVAAPIGPDRVPDGFALVGENLYGDDRLLEFERLA